MVPEKCGGRPVSQRRRAGRVLCRRSRCPSFGGGRAVSRLRMVAPHSLDGSPSDSLPQVPGVPEAGARRAGVPCALPAGPAPGERAVMRRPGPSRVHPARRRVCDALDPKLR